MEDEPIRYDWRRPVCLTKPGIYRFALRASAKLFSELPYISRKTSLTDSAMFGSSC